MLFAETDAPLLRAWIIQRLANTSDADADVLADYVLALLKHDGDVESIRKLFETEMKDFLGGDSADFTQDVFQCVKYRSYVPGAPPPPPAIPQAPPLQVLQIPQGPASQQAQLQPRSAYPELQHIPYAETPTAFPTTSFRNGSRKRAYRDLDAPDGQPPPGWNPYNSSYQQGAQNPSKAARRGGGGFAPRGSGFADSNGMRSGYPPASGSAIYGGAGGGFGSAPEAYSPHQPLHGAPAPTIDANTIIENIRQLQELGAKMGIPLPQVDHQLPKPVFSGPAMSNPKPQRRRPPCRDYETKGFCSRGNRCMFEHGNESIYVPSFTPPPPTEEYDPNNATLPLQIEHPEPLDMATLHMPPQNRREFKKPKRKGGRAPFSADGPTNDRTNTKIVVENIPEEHFTEDEIRNFFIQFGTIGEISLRRTHKCIAVIKFDSWASANAAWKSPKVVFDNRFVKVYWYKDETQFEATTNGAKNGAHDQSGGEKGPSVEPEFDLEEFKRKQEAVQKAHEEKVAKREQLERERQDLEEKQRELAARQQEEKRKLEAKLSESGVKEASLSPILSQPTLDGAKPSQAEALRAKLAELEAEANSLGIDPDDDTSSWSSRGRGRGRRPYRGRGNFAPRSYRGGYGYRGRGGAPHDRHAAYAAFSLDNRPKIVAVTGVDFTDAAKDEALRQYLFGIGEFTAIHSDATTTHITFKDRKTAEQFMFGVSASKSISGVDGELELSWATSALKSLAADADTLMASGLEDEQNAKGAEVEESNGFGGSADVRDQGDMDYEGGEGEMIW